LESDHYEDSNVTCGSSKIDGAGDGLFARKDLPENRIVSYYNGLYINHGETYSSSNCNYQVIFPDVKVEFAFGDNERFLSYL